MFGLHFCTLAGMVNVVTLLLFSASNTLLEEHYAIVCPSMKKNGDNAPFTRNEFSFSGGGVFVGVFYFEEKI